MLAKVKVKSALTKIISDKLDAIGKKHAKFETLTQGAEGKLLDLYTYQEIGEVLLHDLVIASVRSSVKRRGMSATLAGQSDMFPDALLESTLDSDGTIVKFKYANMRHINVQRTRFITNKIEQDVAFARVMAPIAEIDKSRMSDNPKLTIGDVWEELKKAVKK